ncbi:hypothetical protein S7711_01345 [Stachybotrys chartarum IBT 7711]|uniref:Uncharacterized protein n=1 Tax=Stachybotrys chartarum (strain CBS 109288 / IBT 7711) TaxID=1280523 RepID=A0A084BBS4_STACB|nr:hypothetical protein S7711_01345 [Stachybotrys chartarum IBT 7711]
MAQAETPAAPSPAGVKFVSLKPIDQRSVVRQIRTLVFFVVKATLDVEALRASLDTLIRLHLPILGASVKFGAAKGDLGAYQYPERYPDDAVLFAWSAASVGTTLEAAGLLPDVSKPEGAVVWGRKIPDFEVAWTPQDWPRECKDDKPDTPLLLVHVTSYQDATVVSVNIPHFVSDQRGIASMMTAWLLVAGGKPPPQFVNLGVHDLDGPTDLPSSELRKKGTYRLKTKGEHIRTIIGFMPDIIRNREEERRVLILSAATVASLRDKCNKEVEIKYGKDGPSLTNGDIVSAVLIKVAFYPCLSRGRHSALPSGTHYLHNGIAYAGARFEFNNKTPLAEIARHHRSAIIETAKEASIERSFAISKKTLEGGFVFPIGEPGDIPYHITNWSSAWHEIDFSSVITGQVDSNGAVPEKPSVLVLGHAVERGHGIHRLQCPIMCKAEGGYWCDYSTSAKNMALIDELLKKDPFLESL